MSSRKDSSYRNIEGLINEGFISVCEVDKSLANTFRIYLHTGEADAIALAKKFACGVVLDDSRARRIAEKGFNWHSGPIEGFEGFGFDN